MKTKGSISRKIALRALINYSKAPNEPAIILNDLVSAEISGQDLSLAWEMTMGSIRYKKRLDFIAQKYIKAPIEKQKIEVLSAIRLGIYQITIMSAIPDYAAVDDTVSAAKTVVSKRESGFINAVLRAVLREPDKVKYPDREKEPITFLSIYYSYPEWLVKRWLGRFGIDDAEKLLIEGNNRPKTCFKIVETKIDWKSLLDELEQSDIEFDEGRYFPDFFSTTSGRKTMSLKSFENGSLIVQDESQGIPLYLLDPPLGTHVLDLCAAPGGKTIAIADKVGSNGKVTAVDFKKNKLSDLADNVKRTGFKSIGIINNDILDYAPDLKYKYILLDVPCSGLGTISNNADLRWTKSENDIMVLSKMQIKLLEKASEFLADDGVIVYSTCTTESEEIEDVVKTFVKSNPEFKLEDGNSSSLEPFKTETGIYRSWPHKHGIGGGGFARLRKSK